jgi:tetratricopeptide (TPR) repeat protein
MAQPAASSPSDRPSRGVSIWLFRVALMIAAPVLFFATVEGVLHVIGVAEPTAFFIPDEKPGFYRTNPAFTHPFIPASFDIEPLNFRISKRKDAKTVRIFVFGESAAQGVPEPGFGFAAQLRAQLAARYPDRNVEVYNLGITAINSHVVYRIARQVLEFGPDLFVIYMGNNEVVGPYGPGCAYLSSMPPLPVIRASVWARSTHIGQLLIRLFSHFSRKASGPTEWRGMETFSENTVRATDPRLTKVYDNFEQNLRDLLQIGQRAGIETLLCTVVPNLKDSAPFVSLHRPGLSPDDTKKADGAFADGLLAWRLGKNDEATARLKEALQLDPQYANTHYLLGRLAEARGEREQARTYFIDALHWDALRFRPDVRINEIIRQSARAAGPGVVLIDLARELGGDERSRGTLSGRDILFEHVHLNWEGNRRVAQTLAEKAAIALFHDVAVSGNWLSDDECAAALGYHDRGHLNALSLMATLTGRAPFTNQVTFDEDQALLRKELQPLQARIAAPGNLRETITATQAALKRDPKNTRLLMQGESLLEEAGDYDGALQALDRADDLLPTSPVTVAARGEVLLGLKRYASAEDFLIRYAKSSVEYLNATCGTLVKVWARQGEFDKGQTFFETALKKYPDNAAVRIEYGNLLLRRGDAQGAEQQWQTILDKNPGNEAALEEIVHLRLHQKKPEAAIEQSLKYASYQPKNYRNNTRLAQAFAAGADDEKALKYLQATAESGPANAALHLELARRLHAANRDREMLDQLARARRVAEVEGRVDELATIDGLLRSHANGGE